jgi:hypothetical protein
MTRPYFVPFQAGLPSLCRILSFLHLSSFEYSLTPSFTQTPYAIFECGAVNAPILSPKEG